MQFLHQQYLPFQLTQRQSTIRPTEDELATLQEWRANPDEINASKKVGCAGHGPTNCLWWHLPLMQTSATLRFCPWRAHARNVCVCVCVCVCVILLSPRLL